MSPTANPRLRAHADFPGDGGRGLARKIRQSEQSGPGTPAPSGRKESCRGVPTLRLWPHLPTFTRILDSQLQ